MLLLTFSVTMTCAPEGVNPIWTGVAASDDSANCACEDGTSAWSGQHKRANRVVALVEDDQPSARARRRSRDRSSARRRRVDDHSVPSERTRKYDTVLEPASTTRSACPPSASVTAPCEPSPLPVPSPPVEKLPIEANAPPPATK